MSTATTATEADQRVFLYDVSWEDYERILAIRGEASAPRMTYLEGVLELMSPSINHELIKKTIARLVEAYAEERGLALNGAGSWTVKKRKKQRGAEADECYILGPIEGKQRPDFAIEVVWTSGGLDKLDLWRKLGVPEVWIWEDDRLSVHALRGEAYRRARKSRLVPELDLARLLSFMDLGDQTGSVRAYRAWLRGE